MKKVLSIFVLVMLLCVPVMAQEKPQQLTQIERLEQLSEKLLDWKLNFGDQVMKTARAQNKSLTLQKKVRALQAALKKVQAELKNLRLEATDVETIPRDD